MDEGVQAGHSFPLVGRPIALVGQGIALIGRGQDLGGLLLTIGSPGFVFLGPNLARAQIRLSLVGSSISLIGLPATLSWSGARRMPVGAGVVLVHGLSIWEHLAHH